KGTNEDVMKINNLIACLNLRMAKYPQDSRFPSDERKNELLNEATKHFNIASQISSHDAISWVGKGNAWYLHLLRNDPNMAMNAFTNATNLASNNIPALFGQARVYYHRKDYRAALKIYQQIMQADPSLTEPDPRVGIGLCYNKLNNFDQAIAAFDRAIELNPNNISANILLATMELDISKQWQQINEEERLTNFATAMRRSNKVLEFNPNYS
ncbi:1235_t:CDS:2, partial [Acaulospora morrowiae]